VLVLVGCGEVGADDDPPDLTLLKSGLDSGGLSPFFSKISKMLMNSLLLIGGNGATHVPTREAAVHHGQEPSSC
jgi:hypothetical protein